MRERMRWVGVLVAIGCGLIGRDGAATDGYFDPTWPGAGRFAFNGDNGNPAASSQVRVVAVESSGNLFLGGPIITSKETWWLGELSADGQFVATFGANDGSGRITSCQAGLDCAANHPLLDAAPAGAAFVLVGNAAQLTTAGGHALAGGGFGNPVTVNDANGFVVMRRAAVQADGKILVAGTGYYTLSTTTPRFGVVRFNAGLVSKDHAFNATTDAQGVTFDGGFVFGASASDVYGTATDVLVRPDGRIVLVGFGIDASGTSRIEFMQLHPDGSLDASFGNDGVAIPASFSATTLTDVRAVLDRGGRLFVASEDTNRLKLRGTMVDANGTTAEWNVLLGPVGCVTAYGTAVAVDSAGRVVFGGTCTASAVNYFVVQRLRSNTGALDSSFGLNGVSLGWFDDTSSVDGTNAIAFDRSGRLIVVGVSHPGDVIETAGISRLLYDLVYTNDFESAPRGCLPPNC